MNLRENAESSKHLHEEIERLQQRITELESTNNPAVTFTYADFLFENSGETILIIDPYTMKILDANPNAARRLGYHRVELCRMSLDQIEMPRPLDAGDAETAWQSSTSGTFFYEGQYRHKNGSLIPVEVSSRMVHWHGQDVLINFARDIRWRKAAETALRQLNSSLEQQVRERTAELATEKEKLETVLGSIAEGVAMADAQKNIVYVNPAFMCLTKYSLVEAKKLTFEALFDFSVRDFQAQAAAFAERTAWSGEVKGVRQDGRTYPAFLTIVPTFGGNGRITGYVTSHQDISQIKALDKAQYSFITNVSHQLRTPLTNIKLYTQLLEGNLNSDKAIHYLHVLGSQAERLEHLVQDILELASLDSSDTVLDWRLIDLPELFKQMIESNQARAKMQQQTLRCTMPDTLPLFMGDPNRLRQAIGELLDNAFSYTPPGGTISVTMAALPKNNRQGVAITVQDDGPGIPDEERDQIFDRFFRGHLAEQGHIIGTGLGLCIAQQIAQAHHGIISLETGLGLGTTFTIWLPLEMS